tara:strand:+ start:279 stop:485 length:207 start_codon:yes stop_codon:yes gene_type:complete
MVKVVKKSDIEIAAEFEEIFDGATVEEATIKAHNQKMPGESAKFIITDTRFTKAKIKLIGGGENDGSK